LPTTLVETAEDDVVHPRLSSDDLKSPWSR
jgi:hypothetical protein